MSSTPAPTPPPPSKICFNSVCKEPRPENPRRKGWRLRSGDHAELCDRCCLAYEQGTFCETFHGDVTGWRKCETCGKKIHCGCIVSVPTYVLLDAGGVECIVCARNTLSSMAPNHMWSHLHMSSQVSERPKEHPVRTWTQMSSSFPGQWRQGTHFWNNGVQSDLQQRLSFEFDRPNAEKLIQLRSSVAAQEKKVAESSNLNHVVRNGTAGVDSTLVFNKYHRDQRNPDGLQDSGRRLGDNDTISARKGVIPDPCSTTSSGVNFETHPNCAKPLPSSILKGDSPSLFGLSASFSSPSGSIDPDRLTVNNSHRQMAPPLPKQLPQNPHNMNESAVDMHNGRSRIDARARAQLLPRYWPRITDQELQQISGDSNSVITPLFEKMLSASDAGRIGRLVLPKKCAEAYFPAISLPEGLPLKVQDVLGNEWAFQFRFWPNNNSRMYVLEGVTPCIQAMKLQAGDIVTFSRIDPEGKLVMGYRKPANVSSEQDAPTDNNKNSCNSNVNEPPQAQKGNTESRNPAKVTEHVAPPNLDKTEFIQKDEPAAKSSQGLSKRKSSILGSKSKRLRIENEDSVELNFTWEESQGLLRPNPNNNPSIVVIEGQEFEEYEDAPILGKPTIFTTNQPGDSCQWVQCEDCSKWRKIPADALLPSRWSCSENRWDPERSLCSSAQETCKELTDILSTKTGSRRTRVNSETNDNVEVSNSLDTLANLAILGEGESLPSSSQPTTRHPRHRPGCSCIVCIQPPSGKGPKHKQTCTCNVCLTVKRRFRTLMMRREKKQSEKDAETATAHNKESLDKSPETPSPCSGSSPQSPVVYIDGAEDDSEKRVALPSPLKAQIDLNIQPEREEEPPSLVADTAEYV